MRPATRQGTRPARLLTRRGTRAARPAFWLLVLGGLCACARAETGPAYAPVAGVQEVNLEWQPTTGMRLVYRVTTDVEASGPLTQPVADKDKKRHVALTRSLEVTDVGPEYFDVRFSQNGVTLPATLRFSRAWEPLKVQPDSPVVLGDKEQSALEAALRQLGEPFAESAKFFGRWKVGDTRPFDIQLSAVPGASGSGRGTMTFRRVVMIDGRQAAEFDWKGRTEFVFAGDPGRGAPGTMTIAGQEWRDLVTGASLRLTAKAEAEFTRQGQPTKVEYQTDEVLDASASRF